MEYKPKGYNSLSPYLVVKDAQALVAFARQVLGAEELLRHTAPDGRIQHIALRIDDSVLMLGEAQPDWPPLPAHLHVYVQDVDAVHRAALDAGATSLQQPVEAGDGDKRGGVLDGNGISWWFGTQVG
jgi:PhnB protein